MTLRTWVHVSPEPKGCPWREGEGWIHKVAYIERRGSRYKGNIDFVRCAAWKKRKEEKCPGFSLPLALQSPISASLWQKLAESQRARDPQKCNFQGKDWEWIQEQWASDSHKFWSLLDLIVILNFLSLLLSNVCLPHGNISFIREVYFVNFVLYCISGT